MSPSVKIFKQDHNNTKIIYLIVSFSEGLEIDLLSTVISY